ncbi:MAG: hypothetical protein SGILL_008773 [Bacillariaceae sp.]
MDDDTTAGGTVTRRTTRAMERRRRSSSVGGKPVNGTPITINGPAAEVNLESSRATRAATRDTDRRRRSVSVGQPERPGFVTEDELLQVAGLLGSKEELASYKIQLVKSYEGVKPKTAKPKTADMSMLELVVSLVLDAEAMVGRQKTMRINAAKHVIPWWKDNFVPLFLDTSEVSLFVDVYEPKAEGYTHKRKLLKQMVRKAGWTTRDIGAIDKKSMENIKIKIVPVDTGMGAASGEEEQEKDVAAPGKDEEMEAVTSPKVVKTAARANTSEDEQVSILGESDSKGGAPPEPAVIEEEPVVIEESTDTADKEIEVNEVEARANSKAASMRQLHDTIRGFCKTSGSLNLLGSLRQHLSAIEEALGSVTEDIATMVADETLSLCLLKCHLLSVTGQHQQALAPLKVMVTESPENASVVIAHAQALMAMVGVNALNPVGVCTEAYNSLAAFTDRNAELPIGVGTQVKALKKGARKLKQLWPAEQLPTLDELSTFRSMIQEVLGASTGNSFGAAAFVTAQAIRDFIEGGASAAPKVRRDIELFCAMAFVAQEHATSAIDGSGRDSTTTANTILNRLTDEMANAWSFTPRRMALMVDLLPLEQLGMLYCRAVVWDCASSSDKMSGAPCPVLFEFGSQCFHRGWRQQFAVNELVSSNKITEKCRDGRDHFKRDDFALAKACFVEAKDAASRITFTSVGIEGASTANRLIANLYLEIAECELQLRNDNGYLTALNHAIYHDPTHMAPRKSKAQFLTMSQNIKDMGKACSVYLGALTVVFESSGRGAVDEVHSSSDVCALAEGYQTVRALPKGYKLTLILNMVFSCFPFFSCLYEQAVTKIQESSGGLLQKFQYMMGQYEVGESTAAATRSWAEKSLVLHTDKVQGLPKRFPAANVALHGAWGVVNGEKSELVH